MKFEPVAGLGGRYPARRQPARPGSYARVPASPHFAAPRLLASLYVEPWLLRETPSTLMAVDGGWRLEASATKLRLTFGRRLPQYRGQSCMPVHIRIEIFSASDHRRRRSGPTRTSCDMSIPLKRRR
ncbi:hypothetical protein G5B40_14225 [Pikeienuella piscinae]|uniref:Uncharacterized protein n=1 Tax=Pikeienuella piscinae TaxID=2748098 RepID=A0A7L5BZG7_9RHOB|nr:hypothetical protein [Pikeienuella piscinae]QIE56503.1 hypothetical protein G5B40_14225 [Pikeienuella piscinae]